MWSFWGGLWWDLAWRMLKHKYTGSRAVWRRIPASSSSWQERGCQLSWCKGRGKCLDTLKHLTVPISRICLSSLWEWQRNHCRAEDLPKGTRWPPLPLPGVQAHLQRYQCHGLAGQRGHGRVQRQGAATGAEPRPRPCRTWRAHPATARAHWHLSAGRIGVSPAPSRRAGGLKPSTSLIFFKKIAKGGIENRA